MVLRDTFSFQQDGLPASEVSISRDQIVARAHLVHHSGSGRLAKPSPWGTSTSYSLPAFLAHSELGQTEKTSRRANAFRFTPDSRPSMPSLAARICRSLKASVPLAIPFQFGAVSKTPPACTNFTPVLSHHEVGKV